MSMSINAAISAYNNAANITKNTGEDLSSAAGSGSDVFAGLISNPVQNSIGSLRKAESAVMGNLTNQADIADVVAAISKAEHTLKIVIAVRDKFVGAFQELEKMPI